MWECHGAGHQVGGSSFFFFSIIAIMFRTTPRLVQREGQSVGVVSAISRKGAHGTSFGCGNEGSPPRVPLLREEQSFPG